MSCSWGQIFVSCFSAHADQAALQAAVNHSDYGLFQEVEVTHDGEVETAEGDGKRFHAPLEALEGCSAALRAAVDAALAAVKAELEARGLTRELEARHEAAAGLQGGRFGAGGSR